MNQIQPVPHLRGAYEDINEPQEGRYCTFFEILEWGCAADQTEGAGMTGYILDRTRITCSSWNW